MHYREDLRRIIFRFYTEAHERLKSSTLPHRLIPSSGGKEMNEEKIFSNS